MPAAKGGPFTSCWELEVGSSAESLQKHLDATSPELNNVVTEVDLSLTDGNPPFPRKFDSRELLPSAVTPSEYDLWLSPDLKEFTFDGKVDITVTVSAPVTSITLHANEINITSAAFFSMGNKMESTSITYMAKKQMATINFGSEIPAGTAGELSIEFEGILNDQMASVSPPKTPHY